MIRKQIIYKAPGDIKLDYNYNYDIMKNIYYYMSIADDVLHRRVHDEGYRVESGHVFKLFNFTLLFENADFNSKGVFCNESTRVKLIISGSKDIVKKILKGILHVKKLKIGESEIKLENIEDDKRVGFKEIMLYGALSPVVETTKHEVEGQLKKKYLSIYESEYYRNLSENAKRKYELVYGKPYEGNIFFDIDDALKVKEKSVKFKNEWIRGYKYDIWIEADQDMQKVIYYLGLGQNSSIGMGCLNFITGVRADE